MSVRGGDEMVGMRGRVKGAYWDEDSDCVAKMSMTWSNFAGFE